MSNEIDVVEIAIFALVGAAVGTAVGFLLNRGPNLPEWRKTVLDVARRHLAAETPYKWGGGRAPNDCGVDCSGLVIVSMKEAGIPLPPEGQTSGVWGDVLPNVEVPLPGDLAFFGPNGHAVHVVIVEEVRKDGEVVTLGANGGDKDMTCEQAIAKGAKVTRKLVSEFKFAPFLGFRTMDPVARGISGYDPRYPVLCCN